jgi:hypothetical protein
MCQAQVKEIVKSSIFPKEYQNIAGLAKSLYSLMDVLKKDTIFQVIEAVPQLGLGCPITPFVAQIANYCTPYMVLWWVIRQPEFGKIELWKIKKSLRC